MSDLVRGTFAPNPRRASIWRMARGQGTVEAKLMIKHGEQQILSIVMPVAILVATSLLPLLGDRASVTEVFPMVLAIAATSSGFTGQAISVAFDRRYGALKRIGASGVPSSIIITGKVLGVLSMVILQVVVLTALAIALGWRTSPLGIALIAVVLLLGVITFTSLGLLIGGTLQAELVLGVANLLWLILAGVLGWVLYSQGLADPGWWNLVPIVALGSGITVASTGAIPVIPIIILVAWAVLIAAAAIRWFRFE